MRLWKGKRTTNLPEVMKEKMDGDISLTKEYETVGVATGELAGIGDEKNSVDGSNTEKEVAGNEEREVENENVKVSVEGCGGDAVLREAHGIDHLVNPTRDYLFAPSLIDIRGAIDFIHRNASSGRTTYVHCKAGHGRSTTVVLC